MEAWLTNVDEMMLDNGNPSHEKDKARSNGNVLAVCIGGTTAVACKESQRWEAHEIFYPKNNSGIEGWAESCISAIQYILDC